MRCPQEPPCKGSNFKAQQSLYGIIVCYTTGTLGLHRSWWVLLLLSIYDVDVVSILYTTNKVNLKVSGVFSKEFVLFVCILVSVNHLHAGTFRSQRALGSMELELKTGLNCSAWLLRNKLWTFVRVESPVLSHRVIPLVPNMFFCLFVCFVSCFLFFFLNIFIYLYIVL